MKFWGMRWWLVVAAAIVLLAGGTLLGWALPRHPALPSLDLDWAYVLNDTQRATVGGTPVVVRLYCSKAHLADDNSKPTLRSLVLVETPGDKMLVPLVQTGCSLDPLSLVVPKRPEPLLGICDSYGGNAFNTDLVHILSLSEKGRLECVGSVTAVTDVDHDGVDDLVTYDDRFESNDYTCHADAPAASVFWKVEDGRLSRDPGHAAFYRSEIARLDKVIAGFPRTRPTEENEALISAILEQSLDYTQLGLRQEGQEAYRRHIRRYDEKVFYLFMSNCGAAGTIPVKELEALYPN